MAHSPNARQNWIGRSLVVPVSWSGRDWASKNNFDPFHSFDAKIVGFIAGRVRAADRWTVQLEGIPGLHRMSAAAVSSFFPQSYEGSPGETGSDEESADVQSDLDDETEGDGETEGDDEDQVDIERKDVATEEGENFWKMVGQEKNQSALVPVLVRL